MKRMSLVLMLLLLATGCEVSVGSQNYPAVCEINTATSGGSGTLIGLNESYALILTCRHVAGQEGNDVVLKWWVNGKEQTTFGRVMLVMEGDSYSDDQALVIGQKPVGIKPVPVGKFDPKKNVPLVCVGWRNGKLYETIAKFESEEDGIIKINQPLIGGMSGGPCFQGGVLVGVGVGSNRVNSAYISNGPALEKLIKIVSEE